MSTPAAGRCGQQSPVIEGPAASKPCVLTHGHAGWHEAEGGMPQWGQVTAYAPAREALAREAYLTYQVAMLDAAYRGRLADLARPDWEILGDVEREAWAHVADRIVQVSWGDRSPLELAAALVKEWKDLAEGTVPVTPQMQAAARAVGRCAAQLGEAFGLEDGA